ncbi:MAG: hypothetical protein ACUVQ1_01795 [Candidatus Kapaibacteriales bacterium]
MKNLLIILAIAFSILTCVDRQASKLKSNNFNLPFNIKIYNILKPFNRTNIVCFVPNNYEDVKTLTNEIPDSVKIFCSGNILDCEKIEPTVDENFNFPIPIFYYLSINQVKDLSKCQTIGFTYGKNYYNLPFSLDTTSGNSIFIPMVTIIDDTLIVCSIDLIRIRPSEEEYFPSSERLRVEILNSTGKSIWRSDEGVYFLQIIGKVEPIEIGKVHRYSLSIPKEIVSKVTSKPDKFTFRLSLPIRPEPKMYNLDFHSR